MRSRPGVSGRSRSGGHLAAWLALAAISLAAVASVVGDEAQAASGSEPCIGTWVGWGRNSGSDPWSIVMQVEDVGEGVCGTIEYPSLGCGGVLEQCGRRGDRVVFVERYTHNPGTCAPAGLIDAVCGRQQMKWRWTGIDHVVSVLERRQPNVRTE